mmetsp:Transcript_63717/g.136987  ORF Transcript_63717/g.136987 Transcript_63717/m.136987 type:complete len:219 (-) Transcript_63717:1073-1729(-)
MNCRSGADGISCNRGWRFVAFSVDVLSRLSGALPEGGCPNRRRRWLCGTETRQGRRRRWESVPLEPPYGAGTAAMLAVTTLETAEEQGTPGQGRHVPFFNRRQRSALQQRQHGYADEHAHRAPDEAEVVQTEQNPDRVDPHLTILLHQFRLEHIADGKFQEELACHSDGEHEKRSLEAAIQENHWDGHQDRDDGTNLRHVVEEEGDHAKEQGQVVAQS